MVLELFVLDLFSSKSQLFQDVSGLHGWGGRQAGVRGDVCTVVVFLCG